MEGKTENGSYIAISISRKTETLQPSTSFSYVTSCTKLFF